MTRKISAPASILRLVALFVVTSTIATTLATQAQQADAAHPSAKGVAFKRAVPYDSGGYIPQGVAVADVNGDGKPDLLVTNYYQSDDQAPGVVGVLLGNGDGTFQPVVTYETGGAPNYDVVVADVNGDGKPDLIVSSCALAGSNCGSADGVVSVLFGNGDGTFQAPINYDSGAQKANELALADVNGDGIVDVIVTNWYGGPNGDGTVSVLLGNGNGTFQNAVNYDACAQEANAVAVADVNGDGIPDLVVASYCSDGGCGSGAVSVLLGSGGGTFQPTSTYSTGGSGAGGIAVADVNGDGHPDLVVANLSGSVGVLLGVGNGNFEPVVAYSAGESAPQLVVADMNGDGKPDIVVPDETGVAVLLGNGDGTFQNLLEFSSHGSDPNSLAVADVNGDGKPDIIVTNGFSSSVAVLLNGTSKTATAVALTASPNPSQLGQSVLFTATITSSSPIPNGEIVTFYHGKTVLGTGTTINGMASVSTSFAKPGTSTIRAEYPGDAFHGAHSGSVKQVVEK
jgi:hypothetical protein